MYSFFSLGQCIDGFKKYIRPVIDMDAIHLKGELSGVIFTAISKDASDMIYSIPFGFSPVEDSNAWVWLFWRLRDTIGVPEDLVLVTNRGKSIPLAIDTVFPKTTHVGCYFHLKNNLQNYCRGKKTVKALFHKATYSCSKEEFLNLLDCIASLCPNLHSELIRVGLE